MRVLDARALAEYGRRRPVTSPRPPITLLALLLAPAIAGANPEAAFRGIPAALEAGHRASYFIWRDGAGTHIRWTTAGEPRRFDGRIEAADGPVGEVHAVGPAGAVLLHREVETADDPARPRPGLRARAIRFSSKIAGAVAGLDIPTSATDLRFHLHMDGTPAPVAQIRLGTRSVRPRRNPFRLPMPKPKSRHTHPHPHEIPHSESGHHHHPHPHPHPPGPGHHHSR